MSASQVMSGRLRQADIHSDLLYRPQFASNKECAVHSNSNSNIISIGKTCDDTDEVLSPTGSTAKKISFTPKAGGEHYVDGSQVENWNLLNNTIEKTMTGETHRTGRRSYNS